MKQLTRMIVSIALVESAMATGCGNPTGPSGEGMPVYSSASISVDKNKMMTDLSTDERAAACGEFSRSLTANFGTKVVGCKLKALFAEGATSCQADYTQCINDSKPLGTIDACTTAMQGMWHVCHITIGAYQACFNDRNRQAFDFLVNRPACSTSNAQQEEPASCKAAPCDYDWIAD